MIETAPEQRDSKQGELPDPAQILKRIKDDIETGKFHSEEDIKMVIAPILDEVAKDLGLGKAEYEKKVKSDVFSGRTDALYGRFIIDYKNPNLLAIKREASKAIAQVEEYITAKSDSEGLERKTYFACVVDGHNVIFVRYNTQTATWAVRNAQPMSESDILRILEAMRGLSRKALDADEIIQELGLKSKIAKDFIFNLFKTELSKERSKVLFEEWFKTFQQVVAYDEERLKELSTYYGVKTQKEKERRKLLFAVQTYFAVVMKLISAEVAQLYSGGRWASSYLGVLYNSPNSEELRNKVKELEEEGGFFQRISRIKNYLEGDFFSWYVDEWNEQISASYRQVVASLQKYEPGTSNLEPERIKDLFKLLYENLVPKKLRHSFGEYYTPDWLADLVIERLGLDLGEDIINKKILDPACGSGTFLTSTIRLIKVYGENHNLDSRELFSKIIENVVGYDLNPIAILAARSNYIVALGDLIRGHTEEFEIPVYLADSLTQKFTSFDGGRGHLVDTTVGKFIIPEAFVNEGSVTKVFEFIKSLIVENGTDMGAKEFLKSILIEPKRFDVIFKERIGGNFDDNSMDLLWELYKKIQELEGEGRNRIWINILKNTSAPLIKGKFDYVIGNPPWIDWDSLPENYKKFSEDLWKIYGLLAPGARGGLREIKRDLSMLFIAFSMKNFVKKGGQLGMLCPYTLFKVSAGAGFRREVLKYEIREILDLVEIKPFEGATTRTAMIIIENKEGKQTLPPIELWRPDHKISDRWSLNEVKNNCSVYPLTFYPSHQAHLEEPWLALTDKAYKGLRKAIGKSPYDAHSGVDTGLNGAFWIDIIEETEKELFVRNVHDVGKSKLPVVEMWVEKDLVYPLARGRDLSRLTVSSSGNIIIPHNSDGSPINLETMQSKYPNALNYFQRFKKDLEKRSTYRLMGKGKPFYSAFKISNYTFSQYKVAWQYISGEVSGKAQLNVGLIKSGKDKVTIPNEKLMVIPAKSLKEAYYILGVLNSSIAKLIVASYSIESHISTDIMSSVNVPFYNPKDDSHNSISDRTKSLSKCIDDLSEADLLDEQSKIDEIVASLYNISGDELEDIEADLRLLLNQDKNIVEDESNDGQENDTE